MLISRKRRKKQRLKIYAKTSQRSSRNSCITAEDWHSLKIQIMDISSVYLKAA